MSGVDAREGFWFQDVRVLVRLLRDAISRRIALVRGEEVPPPIRIRIEAAAEIEGAAQASLSPRPLWDSVTLVGPVVIVDETKLGDVPKEQRLALYARIRSTVATQGGIAGISPRLTTAQGAQANEEMWRGLSQESATATIPSAASRAATTATELAQEALFYLTSPRLPSRKRNNRGQLIEAPTPPMNEADARCVLGRFIFDDELDKQGTEVELRRLLRELGGEFILDESIRQLRGWIAEKACVRPEGAEMTSETLSDEVRVLARYLKRNPESEALVQRLRAATPPLIETRLAIHQWRDVQPVAAVDFNPATSKRLVFVGAGGIGKSFTLAQLHREMFRADLCLWIDAMSAVPGNILAEAIALGAWVAKRSHQRLTVFIDGLDQKPPIAVALLSEVHGALAGYDDALVISAARTTTWSLISDASGIWREIRLEPWAADAVKTLSFVAVLPPDLVDLLRTPLLLELYTRTLDSGVSDSFQPTTRHELIAEYFLHRILRSGMESAPRRRVLIEKLGARVAVGESQWLLEPADADVATQLVGEGLLVDAFGRHRFRHALLQDVSVAMAISSSDPDRCVDGLQGMTSPGLRHDVTRCLIEAAMATGQQRALLDIPSAQDLLRAIRAAGLPVSDPVGDVMVDYSGLPAILDAGISLAGTLKWARSAGNRSWLHALARQPKWPRPRWLQPETLDEDLYQLARDLSYTELPEAIARELALRLRSWAGQDLQPVGWGAATVIAAVVRFCPTAETLQWVDSLPILPDPDMCDLFSGLRLIAARSEVLDEEMLSRVVIRGFDSVGLGRNGPRPRTGSQDEGTTQVIMNCLQSETGIPGLFKTHPRAAFRILFELVARHGEARKREQMERAQDPRYTAMIEELGRLRGAIEELQEEPEEHSETRANSSQDVAEGVVNDIPPTGWHPDIYPLHAMWVTAKNYLRDPAVMEIARDEAAKSRSLAARNLIAGQDADVAKAGEWVREHRSPWPDDPLPPNTPEPIGRAWHLLEIIGVSSRFSGSAIAEIWS